MEWSPDPSTFVWGGLCTRDYNDATDLESAQANNALTYNYPATKCCCAVAIFLSPTTFFPRSASFNIFLNYRLSCYRYGKFTRYYNHAFCKVTVNLLWNNSNLCFTPKEWELEGWSDRVRFALKVWVSHQKSESWSSCFYIFDECTKTNLDTKWRVKSLVSNPVPEGIYYLCLNPNL